MKIIRLSFTILSLAYISRGATNEAYEITSYFPDKGIVGIKYGAVRTNRPFSSFSSTEQQQITDWLEDKEFQNGGLSVEITKKKDRKKTGLGETMDVTYVITLENRSEVDFSNIEIESRVFYEEQRGSQEIQHAPQKNERLSLAAGETRTIQTKTAVIRDEKQVSPGFGSSYSFNTPGGTISGDNSFGGAPTVYYKDRLLGMALYISKKNRYGENIRHEFEEGNIPDRKSRYEYTGTIVPPSKNVAVKSQAPVPARTSTNNFNQTAAQGQRAASATSATNNLSGINIETYIQQAEAGDYRSAYALCGQYFRMRDSVKTLYWVVKTREMIAKLPAGDPTVSKMLIGLDRYEKDAENLRVENASGKELPQQQAKKDKVPTAEDPGPVYNAGIPFYSGKAEGGDMVYALMLCKTYSRKRDVEKTQYWADKTRALVLNLPADDTKTKHYLSQISQYINDAHLAEPYSPER